METMVRQVGHVVRVRALRGVRRARDRPMVSVLYLATVSFALLAVVGRLPVSGYEAVWSDSGAYAAGVAVADGRGVGALGTARGLSGLLAVATCYGVLVRTAQREDDERTDHRRLALSPTAFFTAELLDQLAFAGRLVGVVGVAGGVAFAAGAASPTTAVTTLVAVAALVATAVAVTFPVALGVRLAFRHYPRVRRHRLLLGALLVSVVGFAFVRTRSSFALLSGLPVGWYADLALVGAGVGASGGRAVAALVGTPVAWWLGIATARRITDYQRADAGKAGETRGDPAIVTRLRVAGGRLVSRVASRPTAAVARVVWLRLWREPRALLFSGLVVGATAGVGLVVVETLPTALPAVVATYVAVATGAGVTLDPLGTEGAALPLTLTAPHGRERVVTGYALSAAVPGTALSAAAGLGTALAIGASPAACVGAALVGSILGATAPVVSLAAGLRLSPTDAATGSRGVGLPPLGALSAFSAVVALIGMPAIAATAAIESGSMSLSTATTVAVAATALLGLGAGWYAFRDAVGRLDRYEP
ncbi:hypothetical protein DEQ92_10940 [Haloferax sp. Atlit-6N]|uniref:hypothetical protein n=1 Tax=Haloferax sp. Atlit-6N TaxID=2077205 RepID=UPI000E2651BC|nr:hypothetical protein [Haloferax sp. Atlit-6N]REA03623.1 hypothetical protein DEQ92_10940 [Haloferax sp. Atlit-6N]